MCKSWRLKYLGAVQRATYKCLSLPVSSPIATVTQGKRTQTSWMKASHAQFQFPNSGIKQWYVITYIVSIVVVGGGRVVAGWRGGGARGRRDGVLKVSQQRVCNGKESTWKVSLLRCKEMTAITMIIIAAIWQAFFIVSFSALEISPVLEKKKIIIY